MKWDYAAFICQETETRRLEAGALIKHPPGWFRPPVCVPDPLSQRTEQVRNPRSWPLASASSNTLHWMHWPSNASHVKLENVPNHVQPLINFFETGSGFILASEYLDVCQEQQPNAEASGGNKRRAVSTSFKLACCASSSFQEPGRALISHPIVICDRHCFPDRNVSTQRCILHLKIPM